MNRNRFTVSLLLSFVVACSSDSSLKPVVKAPTPSPVRTSINLALSSRVAPLKNSTAFGINDSAIVVGVGQVNGAGHPTAVVWRPPSYAFATLPGIASQGTSEAKAIAFDGTIVGDACDADPGPCHPVYWSSGALHQLGGLGRVNDICSCDSKTFAGETIVNGAAHGALWVDDLLIDVGTPAGFANAELVAIAHGWVVGRASNSDLETTGDYTPFRWSPTTGWVELQGAAGVFDVNSSGTAVGGSTTAWFNGANTLSTLGGGASFPMAVNDSGVIAGIFITPQPVPDVGIWTQADGWTVVGLFDGGVTTVYGINNLNDVVGETNEDDGNDAMLWLH